MGVRKVSYSKSDIRGHSRSLVGLMLCYCSRTAFMDNSRTVSSEPLGFCF